MSTEILPASRNSRELMVGTRSSLEVQAAPALEPPAVFHPGPPLTLDRASLLSKLRILLRAISGPRRLPAMRDVLVYSDRGEAHATATDLEVTVSVSLGGAFPRGAEFLLKPEALKLTARNPDARITLQPFQRKDERQLQVGPIRFDASNPEDYPGIPFPPEGEPIASASFTSCKQVIGAVSTDETRFNLSGVYFRLCKNEIVATDGHRLHLLRVRNDRGHHGDFLVPTKPLRLLEAACPKGEEIRIDFHGKRDPKVAGKVIGAAIVGHAGEFTVTASCLDGEFPDYRQVIPSGELPVTVTIERERLIQALGQAMTILSERARGVKLVLGEQLSVTASNPDVGRFETSVPVVVRRGEGASIGFSARYLVEALQVATSEQVTLEWKDEMSPMRIQDGDFLAVVMPMRLS